MFDRVGLDIETWKMSPTAIFPKTVCVTVARRIDGTLASSLVSNGDPHFVQTFEQALDGAIAGDFELVGHNIGGFDLPDIFINFPHLGPKIWKALELGRVRDTLAREKLINLADHGQIDDLYLPDGTSRKISYQLVALVAKYLGRDRSAEKDKDAPDRWQLNFDQLDGVPSEKFPEDAADYAKTDAVDALLVAEAQDAHAAKLFEGATGHDGQPFNVFATEQLHVGAMFCLALMTAVGFRIDQAEVAKMEEAVKKELTPERAKILIDAGLIRPAVPARPYKNGAKNEDGTPKMVAEEDESTNKKELQALIERICYENKLPVEKTDPTKKFPNGQIKADADVLSKLARYSPVIAEFEHRQGLGKLVSTEIPRLKSFVWPDGVERPIETIHACFDFLKRTGRTSSYAGKFYPSCNIQQIPRGFDLEDGTRVEPRRAFLPRYPDWVIASIDYSTLELVTFAQKCFSIFGHSVLRNAINSGKDVHAYLGATLAYELDNDFYQYCRSVISAALDRDAIYEIFHAMKHGNEDEKKFYKKWRSLAKPVGLSLPGGLGVETLITIARVAYGIHIESVEMAKRLKAIWGDLYPEGPRWLQWFPENNKDDVNSTSEHDRYSYFTPLGMHRAGCDFCAGVNGLGLQSPAGEGCKIAIFQVTRACFDSTLNSCLLGSFPGAFVHDEFLMHFRKETAHECAMETSKIMSESMQIICPDMKVSAEAALGYRWDKNMEPVYVDGRLVPWEPKQ